ncbi:hypothetical protein [Streptomyces sp. NPDC059209]|uniref:hypothetical protein n=1 Tax=Streptomyces sp. NPDC059209 TaxID=3346769 RepID=UPI0036AA5D9A
MTDSEDSGTSGNAGTDSSGKLGDVPDAGTSNTQDAADEAERVSSELYDLIGVKGEASDTGPGVSACGDKDPEKYFRIFHAWTFTPASAGLLDGVMERLRTELPGQGWKVVAYGPDTSKNKNPGLTADNDGKKYSVKIAHFAKDATPNLNLMVVSGCYQVPEGETVDRF